MNGRMMFEFLKTLDDDALEFPVIAALPIRDTPAVSQPYICRHPSVLPNGFISIPVPDARVDYLEPPKFRTVRPNLLPKLGLWRLE